MAGDLLGVTSFSGVKVGGGHAQAASANGNVPASTISGGDYPVGTARYAEVYSVVTVVATTAVATKSTTTTATLSGATIGDFVDLCPASASGLSAGLTVDCWVSAADQITIAYSNVSTANAAQIATPFRVQFIKVVP
jgi:hypothetical protein